MLRYVFLLIVFAIGLPLVMITLGANETAADAVIDDGAFAEQQAPYSEADIS